MKKAFSIIMLILLLMSTFTLASNVSLALADNAADINSDSNLAPQNTEEQNSSSPTILHDGSLRTKFSDQGKLEEENSNLSSGSSDSWNFSETNKWVDFIKVDNYFMEIVVGLNYEKPNSYDELKHIITENDGELVNTISVKGKVQAAVGDIPLESASSFTEEVRAAGLSRYIEPNMKFNTTYVPNDPYWSYQWGPAKIEADYAWDTTVGDPSVLVAVIDTGIDYNHPDLEGNYVTLGYDWVNNDTDPLDDFGHGTHCAGIIAAALNNTVGIAGIANVSIMAEKGLDAGGYGTEDDLANAIIHAVDQGADVLSNSWGGYGESMLIHDAVQYAYNHGVLVIAAAGNEASSTKIYPAAYAEVVAVTATDSYDNPADEPGWGTNFGDWVEVAAPGVDIYSTMPTYHVTLNDYGYSMNYSYMSGTSMACPHVAGVAALIWSQFPNMTRDQVRLQLRFTADDLGDPGFDYYYGYGRINARSAVEQAPPDHDLLILDWEKPRFVGLGDSAIVNTTVFNFGACNETDITVQLLVNGSVVDFATIDFLETTTSETVSCSWTPTIEGTYNLTSYVVPVPSEALTENNVVTAMVCAGHFKYILFDQTHGTDSIVSYNLWVTDLTERGYLVDAHTSGPITSTVLTNYMAFVIPQAHDSYTPDELSVIQGFMVEGGGLLVIGDDAPSVYTDLTSFTGINWVSGGVSGITTDITSHEVTSGVTSVYLGAPLAEMIVGGCAEDLVRDPAGGIMLAVSEQPGRVIGFADEDSLMDHGITREDNLLLADNMIDWLVVRPEHDLAVTMEAPPYVEPGGSSLLNVTVCNRGLNNEINVELFLFINGTTVNNVTIPELVSDSSYTMDYLWTPIVEEVLYNVTGYVIPVENETVIRNNLECVFVYVGYPVKVFVLDSEGTDFLGIIGTWQALSTNWYLFGDKMLFIDYSTLNKEDITYEDLAATEADVLIISCASDPWSGWEFTDSEIEAISQYVHEGHGLIATSGTFHSMVPNNNKLAPLFGLNETTTWDASYTDLLNLQDPTHPLFSGIPNPYIFPETGTAIPFDSHWDSNELVGGEYVALGHFQESSIVVFRGLVYISPLLEYGIPPYYHFHLQLLYNAITWSSYQKPEHELVASLDSPAALKPGESSLLNATVSNMGLSNETDVELFLLIDGVEVNSTTIPLLINGTSYTISHLWSPTVEANYNVTAYVSPVPNEDSLLNNIESKGVFVSSLVVALFKNRDPWGYPSNEEALSLYGIPYLVFSSSDFGSIDLSAFTKVVIASVQDQGFYNAMDAYRWWFEDYVSSGGVLEIHAAHYSGTGWVGTLPGGLQYVQNPRDYVTIVDLTHPVVTTPNYITDPELDNWWYSVHGYFGAYPVNSHIVMIEDSTGYPAYLEFQYGAGSIVASSQTLEFAYSHGYSLILENSLLYTAIRYPHDLAVTLDAPAFLELDDSVLINTTVQNRGLSNETSVELLLLINGTLVSSATIPELSVEESHTINYLWAPAVSGAYNITAYAPPVPGEDDTTNNILAKRTYVFFYMRLYLPNEWIGGGVAMGWHADDSSWYYTLPFDFPFYGTYYRTIYISSNGLITFIDPDSSYSNSIPALTEKLAIAPAWDDWETYAPHDIYIWQNSTHVSIRWEVAALYDSSILANFEAILRADGVIQFNYEHNNGPISATIGISNGAGHILAEDVTSLNYIHTIMFTPFQPEHELVVDLEAPAFSKPGDSTLLNATVLNHGLSNETSVDLFLFINGTVVNSTMVPDLLTGEHFTINYLWTPTAEATYNVTAYAPPVPAENVATNNVLSVYVIVSHSPKVLAYVQYTDYDQEYANALAAIDSTFGPNYLLSELWDYTQLDSMLPGNNILFIPEQEYTSLPTMEMIGEGWSTTLSNFMVEGGVIIVCDFSGGSYGVLTGAGLMAISGVNYITGSTVYLVDPSDALAGGVSNTFIAPDGALSFITAETNVVFNDGTYPVVIHKTIGSGQIALIGFDYYASNPDADRILGNAVGLAIRYEHDIDASLQVPTFLNPGDSSLLNATVLNGGLSNETNLELFLLINGTIVDNATIPELLTGSSYTLSYQWTPTVEAIYNVTAYAPPVPSENVTANNFVSKMVHVRYVTVALISDQSQLLAITPILDSVGVGYDIYNDNSIHLFTEYLDLLFNYKVVIFNNHDRQITSGEHSALQSYLSSGGNLLVTGYDSLGHPDDWLLADVVRSSSVGDNTGEPDLYVVDSTHPIMDGPYGSFPTGYHISGLYSDCDAAEADTGRNAVTVAELADGYDKIIATEGLPGKVVYWNGIGPDDWMWNTECEAMFKNTIAWFMILYEHELAVSLDAQTLLKLGDSSLLNATVYNRGLSNETNVELKLIISGYVVNSTTIPEFDSGSFYTLNYLWTPTAEGAYNITAYARPLVNETLIENNIVTTMVVVAGIPELPTDKPAVYVSPQIVTPALGETFTISVNVFNLTDVYVPDPENPEFNVSLGNLYGFDIQFTWDPTILEYVSHTVTVPVEDYPDGVLHEPFMQLKNVVDEHDAIPGAEPGTRAWFAYSCMFPAEPFNNPEESNTFFVMTFRVIGEGTTDLEFVSTDLCTETPEWILHASLNGLVIVGAPPENRDVAIANVTSYPNAIYTGRIVNITVVAANEGTVTETFNVTVYYNLTAIETKTVYALAPGANTTLVFSWNTTGLTPCSNFTIWAEVSEVPYELNLDNNIFVDGWVKIKMLGDINGDGVVDLYDIVLLCSIYGIREGDPAWNPEADLAPEWGIINLYDAVVVSMNYGKSC
jgi:thermitase